ncbi:unnamed protein product [Penicillium roqueforti FM164]|uniref:Genomic scaffold, ProqFM164S04 n=1 Tax=Penicillium roqueforti (strain FM164) TaxID=1365484 RepID=W6QHB6_PENRF|nr:unnamed protein product [Penicillium roqueforti FM164]
MVNIFLTLYSSTGILPREAGGLNPVTKAPTAPRSKNRRKPGRRPGRRETAFGRSYIHFTVRRRTGS